MGGWSQQKQLPENAGMGIGAVARPMVTIRLDQLLGPSTKVERKPVRIRPPTPTSPPPREPGFGRSLSCEPTPKPIIRRRARSLPSTVERRRDSRQLQVRFVDSLGLDLEEVKVFKVGEDPSVPQHVLSRLLMSAEMAAGKHLEISLPYFKAEFPERPMEQADFVARLCRQCVCLEQVLCSEVGIIATAQVLNLAFEKDVSARYSFTDWKSSAESKATWVSTVHRGGGVDGPASDVFRFRLPVPPFILRPGAALEFAVRFCVAGAEFWDNNDGRNYRLMCHSYQLAVPKECEDSMVHFI
ncbi:protein phosphatase 1 regulatory subunit 3D-like [Arapaima gigas]